MRRLILGTAGHIDHGKTSLVRALTGVDTDRLAEEKRRGITIDLGFAELELESGVRLGIVDVPGHEAFVRNMLAGATGIDLVVLVVAAEEGVMPQTREHLAIVDLLGVRAGVVALTKADLVEEEWLDLVVEDVREALAGTGFADAPLVPVSSVRGEGLEELRDALARAAAAVPDRAADDLFRMAIDRVFTVRGTGTVVTGTVWSGRVRVEESVRLLPAGVERRVRGVQVHGRAVDEAVAGERAAIALAGSRREEIRRGDLLVSDGAWTPASMITARVEVLEGTGWELRQRQRVRFHLGSAERLGRVVILEGAVEEGRSIGPGESAWVQLRLEAPIVARAGDRFVLRSYSPVTTIAGGVVAEPIDGKRKRLDGEARARLERRLDEDAAARIGACVEDAGWRGVPVAELPIRAAVAPARVESILDSGGSGLARVGEHVFESRILESARRTVLDELDAFHAREPLRIGIDRDALRRVLPAHAPAALVESVLDGLILTGEVETRAGLVARAGFEPALTEAQRALRDRILATVEGLTPPMLAEFDKDLREHPDFWPILKLLEHEGTLVAIHAELFVRREVLDPVIDSVRRHLKDRDPVAAAEFRAVLPVSRKYLIPWLEYLDRAGVTARRGEGRILA